LRQRPLLRLFAAGSNQLKHFYPRSCQSAQLLSARD
jgi:hypothetical protein